MSGCTLTSPVGLVNESSHVKPIGGRVIWITGLSGSGKSTLARQVAGNLRQAGISVILLDGDELRDVFGLSAFTGANLDRTSRLQLALRYARLCKLLSDQGFAVVIATISLFAEVFSWNRANIPQYFEVYIEASIDTLRSRDPKGIYRRFFAGELAQVAGLDVDIDEPPGPDYRVLADQGVSVDIVSKEIIEKIICSE